jgi:hypothetical protein
VEGKISREDVGLKADIQSSPLLSNSLFVPGGKTSKVQSMQYINDLRIIDLSDTFSSSFLSVLVYVNPNFDSSRRCFQSRGLSCCWILYVADISMQNHEVS